MKTLLLAALVPATLTVLSPSAPAVAGETPTCRGHEATHVGSPNEALTTTPGPDVVVTNGAYVVRTLNGDDIICVTESGRPFIVPGGGDDVVDARSYEGDQLETSLGLRPADGSSGDDTYLGGDQLETVFVASGVAADHKEIHLDGGDDDLRVDSGYPGTLRAELGKGADRYWTERSRAGSVVDGEEGRDLFATKCFGCREFLYRMTGGSITINRAPGGDATDFEDADLLKANGHVVPWGLIKGTPGANRIGVYACKAHAMGRPGDDVLNVYGRVDAGCARVKGHIDGAGGDDTMTGDVGRDTLSGGSGADSADGRGGSDYCLAEVEVSCER